jgi:alkanesulfonate monooxygenase SsuD/methylene tetrahydromethanopterin reductase-like flavin-dependent oxidoreductase (luciferase family)
LCSFVSPVSFRHPSVLAKLAVTADHVSGGRIELGMRADWYEEHRALGFPFPDLKTRMDIFEEQVAIVRGLLGPAPFAASLKASARLRAAGCSRHGRWSSEAMVLTELPGSDRGVASLRC